MTMIRFRGTHGWKAAAAALLVASSLSGTVMAQDGFRPDAPRPGDRDYRGPAPISGPIAPNRGPVGVPTNNATVSIAEATAVLESVVRTMYSHIEPGRENSPNELTAYADLRVLRLYAGALEVSGWSLQQSYQDFLRFRNGGHYRDGYSHISDHKAQAAYDRYRAYRETVRTMLLRIRTTAVFVEHQVSFIGDPQVAAEWRQEVYPALLDTYAAVEPLLIDEQYTHQRYTPYGQAASTTIIPVAANGLPQNAVEVQARLTTHVPYDGRGHGRGRYFEIRSFGGPIRVRGIRYSSYESGSGMTLPKELTVDEVVQPSRPLFVQCNRGRRVDASQIEIIWESTQRGNGRVYGSIDLVDASPADAPRR